MALLSALRRQRHGEADGTVQREDGDKGPPTGAPGARAPASAAARFRLAASIPEIDAAELLQAQRAVDSSWLPSYAVAQAAADSYPAFLRGQLTGEEVLFSPGRLGLWLDYYFDWSPWATVIGAILGFVGGTAHLIVMAQKIEERRKGKKNGT